MFKSNNHKNKGNKPPNDFAENAPNKQRLKGETGNNISLKELLSDNRTIQLSGAILMAFALFCFFSYLSYWINLFQGIHDQGLVIGKKWDWLSTQQVVISENFMGYLGARISYLLVYKWFGFFALAPIFLLFHQGYKLFTGKTFISTPKFVKNALFWILWGSIASAFFMAKTSIYPGGGIGFYGFKWVELLIGKIGMILFLASTLLIYLAGFLKWEILPHLQPKTRIEAGEITPEQNIPVTENLAPHKPEVAENNTTETPTPLPLPTEENTDPYIFTLETTQSDPESIPTEESFTQPFITLTQEDTHSQPIEETIPFAIEEVPKIIEETIETPLQSNYKEHRGIDEPYDPWLDLPSYQFPTDELLKEYEVNKAEIDRSELENSKNLIVETLKNYNIGIAEIKATIGPTVTLYEIIPVSGVRISKIKNLEDDIALSLAALGIRIIAPIPGKGTIGIEVPNKKPEMVPMSAVIKSKKFKDSKFELPVILGKSISNEIYIADLAKMPHLLVAGATGQGKSVGLNCLIISLLYKKHPTELKFVLVDPKKVELSIYSQLEKHFLAKLPGDGDAIITDTSQVTDTLKSLTIEMDNRYNLLKDAGCRNIIEYNTKFKERRLNPEHGHQFLPYIVAIIDEVADLMMTAGREVETPIARLAQLARAVGIHVILATQRPSVNIITGTIKANFPARIAFRVSAKIDSRTILDNNGADQLIGKGDMLFYSGSELIRLQCPFVDTPEVDAVAEFIAKQRGFGGAFRLPEAPGEEGEGNSDFDADDKDSMFDEAARIVVETQQGSTSMIQRKLKIGYNRAGRLIDQLEAAGVVGPGKGSKARDVLIHDLETLEHFLDNLNLNN